MKRLPHSQRKPIAITLDDHKLFAESFSVLLKNLDIFSEIFTTFSTEEVYKLLREREEEEITLFADYYLQESNLAAYLNELRRIRPKIKIIVVSSIINPILINDLIAHKINGILSKTARAIEIKDCLESINLNQVYYSLGIKKILEEAKEVPNLPLTAREIEILIFFAQGKTVDETAAILNLSRHTIAAHRRKMMAKVKCNNITELLSYARSIDLI